MRESRHISAPWRRGVAVVVAAGIVVLGGCGRTDTKSTAATPTARGLAAGDFGTMRSVCGKGTGQNKATGRGVTANSITLGVVSDAGFTGLPGIDRELWDASDVFTKWCNSLGGINGRKIIEQHLDSAITNYRQVVLEGCQSDFALVGGGGAFDATGQLDRLRCLLPAWPGFVATPAARAAELQWQALPQPLNQYTNGLMRWLGEHYPDSKGSLGYLYASIAPSILSASQYKEVFNQMGMTQSYEHQFNVLGESTWVPVAAAMKKAGVKGLVWVGDDATLAKLEEAMRAVNYSPEWIFGGVNVYTPSLISELNGTNIPTYMPLSFTPFEDAGQNTLGGHAMAEYQQLFKTYMPAGRSHASLGVNAFASWLLFAQGAKACGANLTVRCMYDQMQKTTKFTAGGLTGQVEVASQRPTQCWTAVVTTPTGFKPIDVQTNSSVFNCSPDNISNLTGDYGKGDTLADAGKSLSDLK